MLSDVSWFYPFITSNSKIRGAPAIASLAALSVAQYLTRALRESPPPDYLLSRDSLKTHIDGILAFLYTSRPTAVNLGVATRRLTKTLNDGIAALKNPRAVAQDLVEEAKAVADEDVGRNKQMSKWAGEWLLERVRKQGLDASRGLNVLTVCNTGSLATSVCPSISLSPILPGNLLADRAMGPHLEWSPISTKQGNCRKLIILKPHLTIKVQGMYFRISLLVIH